MFQQSHKKDVIATVIRIEPMDSENTDEHVWFTDGTRKEVATCTRGDWMLGDRALIRHACIQKKLPKVSEPLTVAEIARQLSNYDSDVTSTQEGKGYAISLERGNNEGYYINVGTGFIRLHCSQQKAERAFVEVAQIVAKISI